MFRSRHHPEQDKRNGNRSDQQHRDANFPEFEQRPRGALCQLFDVHPVETGQQAHGRHDPGESGEKHPDLTELLCNLATVV